MINPWKFQRVPLISDDASCGIYCFCSPFLAVPTLPPQNLWANNISSTALETKWKPVPPGFVHGILRGYKVLYKKTNEPSAPYTILTVPPGVMLKKIYQLRKFTFYTIEVLAFTIKGDGAPSPQVNVTTDEDSKYKWYPAIQSSLSKTLMRAHIRLYFLFSVIPCYRKLTFLSAKISH